jgi:hypothetical protein
MLLTTLIAILLVLLMCILGVLAMIDQTYKKAWLKLRNAVFWNASLRIFIEGYLPAAYELLKQTKEDKNWGHPAFFVINLSDFSSLLLMVALPALIYLYLRRKTHEFREPAFRARFSETVDNLTRRKRESPIYVLVFCYTRLLIACVIVYS